MDDAEYYVKYLKDFSCEEMKRYLEQHPTFMTSFEKDARMESMKEETYRRIVQSLRERDLL